MSMNENDSSSHVVIRRIELHLITSLPPFHQQSLVSMSSVKRGGDKT